MITDAYKKGMKIGAYIRPFLDIPEIIPENWSDSVELAHLVDYIDDYVTGEKVMRAVAKVKELDACEDRGWNDNVRGFIAGCYFGHPYRETLRLAEKAEQIWDDDIEGRIGYYQQVCDEIRNTDRKEKKERRDIARARATNPVTNIQFLNESKFGSFWDATQFDTQDEKELAELWWEFCKENNLINIEKVIADYETGITVDD